MGCDIHVVLEARNFPRGRCDNKWFNVDSWRHNAYFGEEGEPAMLIRIQSIVGTVIIFRLENPEEFALAVIQSGQQIIKTADLILPLQPLVLVCAVSSNTLTPFGRRLACLFKPGDLVFLDVAPPVDLAHVSFGLIIRTRRDDAA